MNPIIIAAIVVVGIGAVCAAVLVVASKLFGVEEDERVAKIRECLPGANCGACGYVGCDDYAKALSKDKNVKANLCIPGSDLVSKQISEILGVEFENVIEQIAFVHCYGDCEYTSNKMEYAGVKSCLAEKTLYGGKGKCTFGCLGHGDCVAVCPHDAICIENGIARINTRKCVGCGLCEKTCPQGIIEIVPDSYKMIITCSNTEKGAIVRNECSKGCIGCKKCEKACPHGAITVTNNLAQIDYEKCCSCGECVKGCPVGCIVFADFKGKHNT